jgi:galactokinase
MDRLYDLGLTGLQKVMWASEVEHGTGVRGGKMDQYAICHGQSGKAMLLDCRTLSHKELALPESWQFLLLNTGVKHNLALTAYNQRREEAENALDIIRQKYEAVMTLRDVSLEQINDCLEKDSLEYQRACHVVTENQRVKAFELCAQMGDIRNAGRLLNQSHASLRDQYHVSCNELDFLQDQAMKKNSIFGSRMMGGGFGGCTISLIQEFDERDIQEIRQAYHKKFGLLPDYHLVHPAPGLVHYD